MFGNDSAFIGSDLRRVLTTLRTEKSRSYERAEHEERGYDKEQKTNFPRTKQEQSVRQSSQSMLSLKLEKEGNNIMEII